MTYTDEADAVIRNSPRTLEPGDLVCHEDGFQELGHVLEHEDNGCVKVYWPTGKCTSVRGDRLRLLERPSAYLAVSFEGYDEVAGTPTSYCFAVSGDRESVIRDKALFEKVEGYTVLSFRIPEETFVPVEDDDLEPEELDPDDTAEDVIEDAVEEPDSEGHGSVED